MNARIKTARVFLILAVGAGAVFFSIMRPPDPDFGQHIQKDALANLLGSREPVLILVHADWCADCPAFAKRIRGPEFAASTARFKKFEYDATEESAWRSIARLGLDSVPAVIAVDGAQTRVLPAYSKIPAGILEAFLRGAE